MRTFLFPPHRSFLGTRGRRRKFGRIDLLRDREAKGLSQQDQVGPNGVRFGSKADIFGP